MDYSIFVYLVLTAAVVAMAWFVNLPAGRKAGIGEGQPNRKTGISYCGITRQQMWNLILTAAVFFLLFAVSACRIAVGNDYWVYRDDFLLIEQNRHVSFEFGFVLVVRILQSMLNFDQYLPIFAFFSFFTVLFFVRGIYDQSEQFCYSLYLLMTAGYYFSSLNSVRYYLVLAIAMYSMKYVVEEQWGKFILWILAAAAFHKSVLVVIPLYAFAYVLAAITEGERGRKTGKWIALVLGIGVLSLILFQDIYREIIFYFYPFYEGSMFDTGETSLTNIAKCGAVLILSLIYYRAAIRENKKNRFYFFCNLGALLLYVFAPFIPEISRIGYYLNITNIFLIPGILVRIPERKQRIFWTAVTGAAFLMYFALFLRSAYNTDVRLLPYMNWIFQ